MLEQAILQELRATNNLLSLHVAVTNLIAFHAGHISHERYVEIRNLLIEQQEMIIAQRKVRHDATVLTPTQPF